MTEKIFCKIYFEELNSEAAYMKNFPDPVENLIRKSKANLQILD